MTHKQPAGDRSSVYLSLDDRAKAAALMDYHRIASLAALVRFLINRSHQEIPTPPPARPEWQTNWDGYTSGARSTCAACQHSIIFTGQLWEHEGMRPRHIGMPSDPPPGVMR